MTVAPKPSLPRDAKGRFSPGFSGNARGRPTLPLDYVRLSAVTRDSILAAASRPVSVQNANGKTETVTLFEARILELASGKPQSRIQCFGFIKMVLIAAGSRLPEPPPPVNPSPEEVERIIQNGSEREFEDMLIAQGKWHHWESENMSDAELGARLRKVYRTRKL